MNLYPHQDTAMEGMREAIREGHTRFVLRASTGFGKTVLGFAIIDGVLKRGGRVIFTVPSLTLIEQTYERLWAAGFRDLGVIQGQHPLTNYNAKVQVASVQTLMNRRIPPATVVIVDECHHWFKFYGKWMADVEWRKTLFIGLSATPWTKGLGQHYTRLVDTISTQQLIDMGFLSRFKVFAPDHPDLRGVKTVETAFGKDYAVGGLSAAMQKPTLVANAIQTWVDLADNRPTLCFGVDRAHAQALQNQFLGAGVPTGYIDAHTPRAERNKIRDQMASGDLKVVCNVGCLTTGVDWDIRCISLCRPTKSEILYTQIIGRGLRPANGKDHCLILDHSDTTLNLGFVTDIHHDALDDGQPNKTAKSKPEEKKPKECPSCKHVKPLGVHVCPNCGFVPTVKSQQEHAQGQLTELTPKQAKVAKADKQKWYSMLMHHAYARGYKPGWAANKYREKFGVWPRGLSEIVTQPDAEVSSWIKSRQIAFAKRRPEITSAPGAQP